MKGLLLQKVSKRTVAIALVAVFAAVGAYAAINFFQNYPTFQLVGFDLVTTGQFTGLGSTKNVMVTVEATGFGEGTCTNPSGKQQPPGQNPVPITATGSQTFHPDKSGNATFSVTSTPTAPGDACPSGHWTFDITSVTYTSATVSAITSNGETFSQTFSLANCTSTSPTFTGSCTSNPSGSVH